MKEFGFDEPQAEAIVSLRLYRLSNTDITILRNEFAELVNKIEETKAIIENENVLHSVIIKELRAVKKEYGTPRRTKIEGEVENIVIDRARMVTNEHVVITVSRDAYIKRVSMRSYNASNGTATGLKAGDSLIGTIECDTVDTLLLFTNKGNYASLPVWQIEDAKWKDIGTHLNKNIRIDGDDKIINAVVVKDFNTWAWIVTFSSGGQVKKTPVSGWQVERNSKVMTAMNLPKGVTMINAVLAYEGQQVLMVSRDGFAYRFSIDDVPSTGVKSKGVKAITLGKGDAVGYGTVISTDASSILFMSDTGGMKRVRLNEIMEGGRPAKGNLICRKLKTAPTRTVYAAAAYSGQEFIFSDPEIQTIRSADIPLRPRDGGYSSPLVLKAGWQIRSGIEECRIIDIPEDAENTIHDDIEKLSLFDEEE
jgi:topoisomerase-4 subunit A